MPSYIEHTLNNLPDMIRFNYIKSWMLDKLTNFTHVDFDVFDQTKINKSAESLIGFQPKFFQSSKSIIGQQ